MLPRISHCSEKLGNRIFIFGGERNDELVDDMECLNLENLTVQSHIAKLSTKRSLFASAKVNDTIYAIGGNNSKEMKLKSVEKYCAEYNCWYEGPPLPHKERAISATTSDGVIYVSGTIHHNTLKRYDPRTKNWSNLRHSNLLTFQPAIVTTPTDIYLIGGYDGHKSVKSNIIYDIRKNEYRTSAPFTREVTMANAVYRHGKIYLLGGLNKQVKKNIMKSSRNVCVYDIKEDIWNDTELQLPFELIGCSMSGL
uniref:Kelch-like protein 10 n=1 Tax=Rhabditophanes sp. KR3021 TaxID=114890 RepID=A0AC35TGE7_9BILA